MTRIAELVEESKVIEWQDELSVGVLEIDIQHKLLFQKFNAFIAAYQTEPESEGLYRLFWFLEAYAVTHFTEEEKQMQRVGYPDYLKHRACHLAFAGEIGRLKERLRVEGATQSVIYTIKSFISGWLVDHISTVDREIGRFLKASGAQ